MSELWEYEGVPADEEIQDRKVYFAENPDHLAISLRCPNCDSTETRWVRNQYHICFGCDSYFTTSEHREDAGLEGEDVEFWRQFE